MGVIIAIGWFNKKLIKATTTTLVVVYSKVPQQRSKVVALPLS